MKDKTEEEDKSKKEFGQLNTAYFHDDNEANAAIFGLNYATKDIFSR